MGVYYGGGAEFNYPENNCCACGKQCGGDTSLSFAILSVSNVSNKSMDTALSPEAQSARPSLHGASNFTGACPGCRQCASENGWCSETLPCCDADARCESLLGGSGARCVKQSSGCVAEGAICGGHGMLTQQCCGDHQCQWQGDKMRCITVETQCALQNSWCSDTLPCCDADARCESLLGGSGAECVKQSQGDTPNWHNGFHYCSSEVPPESGTKYCSSEGWTCAGYEWHGWCQHGEIHYGAGAQLNYPEDNCCACGKECSGSESLAATIAANNVSNSSKDV